LGLFGDRFLQDKHKNFSESVFTLCQRKQTTLMNEMLHGTLAVARVKLKLLG